ncbi:FAD-dependent monooxygenase [Algoriphagus sp.]|uniref:FAD-dependent monooxygenase n=1 Tax=Algoriphagus sp. TaxID=1872435 RepID=UPI003F6FA38E
MKIDIIGAGIGGLSTALALEKKGFQPRIFEQARELKALGAGIILASNAMQVYRKLGLEKELIDAGIPLRALTITDKNLEPISRIDLSYFKDKYGLQSVAIHRGRLQEILLGQLKQTELCLDHTLKNITVDSHGCQLEFEKGHRIHSNLLVAADGIRSKVRDSLFPESKIRTMNQVCWRGVTDFILPDKYKNELHEAWGHGDRFAFVQFDKKQIYWYAVKSFGQSEQELSADHLSSYFRGYPKIVREIIHATAINTLHTTVMQDLNPIHNWHSGAVCLLGDAAHATTPNMGQGACQSIEDAYILAECLSQQDIPEAFAKYQQIRMPKAHQVVNQSWQIGKISHWKSPISAAVRNSLLRMVPARVNRVQLEKLFELEHHTS